MQASVWGSSPHLRVGGSRGHRSMALCNGRRGACALVQEAFAGPCVRVCERRRRTLARAVESGAVQAGTRASVSGWRGVAVAA